jgi:hypothetical protein
MSSIYARLGFNSADPLTQSTSEDLSANVQVQLSFLPPLLTPWQIQDVATSNTSGYFSNPVANIISYITSSSHQLMNSIIGVSGTTPNITSVLSNTSIVANTIVTTTCPGFLYHTNRISNTVGPDTNTNEVHYQTAMGIGKTMVYIVSQSDGIKNNSPIMGNFTALYTNDTLTQQKITLDGWITTLNNSITLVGSPPEKQTSLTLPQVQEMYNVVSTLNSTMVNYRAQDNAFFLNSRAVLDDFNVVRQFTGMGQTETDLVMNYIGSDKIKQRLEP